MKRSPLRKRSKKREILDAEYYERRRVFLELNPYCKLCGGFATDVHHVKRRGKHYLDMTSWLPCCRADHQKIESNGKWAREMGYIQDC